MSAGFAHRMHSTDVSAPSPTAVAEELGILSLGRRSATYALGGLAYKGLALLSVPLVARLLSPAELGLLDLAAVMASVVGYAVAMGSDQGVAYLEARTSPEARAWESTLAMVAFLATAFLVVAFAASEPLARVLTGDQDNGRLVMAAALYGGVIGLTSVALTAVRLRAAPRAYAVVSFLIVAAEMLGAVAVALLVESPVMLMVLAWAGGAGLVSTVVLLRYLPRLRLPRAATVRRLLVFGAPLVPAAVAWLLGDAVIRASMARHGELVSLGEYGIAYRVASLLALAVGGFAVAWHPYLYRTAASSVLPRAARVLTFAIIGLGAGAVTLTLLAPEIVLLLAGGPYAGAADAVAPLAGGMVAFGGFAVVSAVVGASGSTGAVGMAAIIGASVQALAAVTLVERFGLGGAAIASLSGYLVGAMVLLGARWRLLLGHSGARSIAVMILVAAALLFANAALGWSLAARIALAVLAVAAFAGVAAAVRVLERRQVSRPRPS